MTAIFRRERHSVTDLKIHLVCVTKYRRSIFTLESLSLIEKSFQEVRQMRLPWDNWEASNSEIVDVAEKFIFANCYNPQVAGMIFRNHNQ